ncbi:TadE/TadG family type IV pilus assembly protein, partial [Vibrio parahaemolyticus]|uniref:TadE/TadG family type IV pilus assembly protein n=4 Tax=Vibrio parahaemolyticus TaxID=670 RepID=UPI001E56A182
MRRKMQTATRRTQKGITLVLISMVLLILLGVAAFGIDLNHQVLNKTRLQNAVDTAGPPRGGGGG